MTPTLELYELRGGPYCAKVCRALADRDLEYESHEVPRSKQKRTKVGEVSGQTGVPVVVDAADGIEGMPESDDIVAYLYAEYGDGKGGAVRVRRPSAVAAVLSSGGSL